MKNILIIEDDNHINDMLSKLLQLNHYHTFSAYSGTEGILLHNSHIDLILLDLMLPGKNGEEIISELQHKKKVPIIVISAIYDTDKKINLLKLGADDYMIKPFDSKSGIKAFGYRKPREGCCQRTSASAPQSIFVSI